MTVETRDVWGADSYEEIVTRNTLWMKTFVVQAVKALRRDGRPLGTAKVSEQERMLRLLEAGPAFWDALQRDDPEAAAQMAADIFRARAAGRIPAEGPRVEEAAQMEEEQDDGTQPASPLPTFAQQPTDTVV